MSARRRPDLAQRLLQGWKLLQGQPQRGQVPGIPRARAQPPERTLQVTHLRQLRPERFHTGRIVHEGLDCLLPPSNRFDGGERLGEPVAQTPRAHGRDGAIERVVYGGIGRAAGDWDCYDRIVGTLRSLEQHETLLIQSGKPVGVFTTHPDAPRVLIANSNLVPHWATWEHFNELDQRGLAMYGQMTAGSWIYIGSQGIVQGAYETFDEMGRRHFGGQLGSKWILTSGLGGMGGAQPLAATMAGASMLAVECRQSSIAKRLETAYVDVQAPSLDEALEIIGRAQASQRPVSVALLGNITDVLDTLQARGIRPDAVTDQTSAHDPVNGYLPQGWSVEQWDHRRAADPSGTAAAASRSMAHHVECLLRFKDMGIPVFDYGNNIRQVARDHGVARAFDIPGFVPEYIRPLFCRGKIGRASG